MEDLKKYKWLIISVLAVAIPFLIYNNFIAKKTDEDPYGAPSIPQQPAQNNTPRPQNPASGRTSKPATGGNSRVISKNKNFEKYEEIVKEIYGDFKAEEVIKNNKINYFMDFKYGPEMYKKAKSVISTNDARIKELENRMGNSSTGAAVRDLIKNYMKVANKAMDKRNYLKGKIYGEKAKIELDRLVEEIQIAEENAGEGEDVVLLTDNNKGPNISYIYKGFIMFGSTKIALINAIKIVPGLNEEITLLKIRIKDELTLSDGVKYYCYEIDETQVIFVDDFDNPTNKRLMVIDQKN